MISIFDYTDYRKFLKDFYTHKKSENSHYSYRYIAGKVGFKSAGHFSQIIQGKANISPYLVKRFAEFLRLKKKEAQYFELLVNFSQAKIHSIKTDYYERILEFNSDRKPKVLSPDQYEFYQKWYYAVIRDILSIYPFSGNFRKLASLVEPTISTAEAKKAIALLERLRLIQKDADDIYRVTDAIISGPVEGRSIAVSTYAIQMLDQAKDAIEFIPRNERNISGVGFSISEDTFEQIQREIRDMRKRILFLVEKDPNPDRVYHCTFQLFPVSKKFSSLKKEEEK